MLKKNAFSLEELVLEFDPMVTESYQCSLSAWRKHSSASMVSRMPVVATASALYPKTILIVLAKMLAGFFRADPISKLRNT